MKFQEQNTKKDEGSTDLKGKKKVYGKQHFIVATTIEK